MVKAAIAVTLLLGCALPGAAEGQDIAPPMFWIRGDTIYHRLTFKGARTVDTLRYVVRDSTLYAVTRSGLRPLSPGGSRNILKMARAFTRIDSILRAETAERRPPFR